MEMVLESERREDAKLDEDCFNPSSNGNGAGIFDHVGN